MKILLSLILVTICFRLSAQRRVFTHSHNDYNNPLPFYKAFNSGYNSIEADIFLVDGKLLVAHDKNTLKADRTLKAMYLEPIAIALQKDSSRRLCLLIDVKEDYKNILPELINELKPLQALLMTGKHPNRLKILISGNRPPPDGYKNYPDFLFFDDDLIFPHTKAQWERVGQVSLDFGRYSKWKGDGTLPDAAKRRIKYTLDSVHTNTGKLVRFWGAPDLPESWRMQIDLGADLIGTDKLEQLAGYLSTRNLMQLPTAGIPLNR